MPTIAEIVAQEWLKNYTPKERARLDATAYQMQTFFRKVNETADGLAAAAIQAAKRAETDHERGQLFHLYRQRRKWKKADIGRLNTYRLNKAARKQMAVLADSRIFGPGATAPFKTWTEHMTAMAKYFGQLFDPNIKGIERLRLLRKHSNWYPHFVEMTYRGEYERLKQLGGPAVHDAAEQMVADAFLISRSSVRGFCVEARKDFAAGSSRSPSIIVSELEIWKESGLFPELGALK